MSKRRFTRWVALAGCSVLIGGLGYTPQATAHIGASHAPFNTDLPDLLSASIVGGTTVRACFDVSIDEIIDESFFSTYTYDSFIDDRFDFSGGDGVINPDNDKCVDLDGSANPSLDQSRLLTVGGGNNAPPFGAVQDADDRGNSGGTIALTGGVPASAMHETDAPELLTATRVGATERVRFGFDEPVDDDGGATTPQADEFGFHAAQGDVETGQSITAVDDNEVEVEFDGTPSVGEARLFFTDTENSCTGGDPAVWDLGIAEVGGAINTNAKYNVLDTILTGTPSGRTDDPDLTGVTVVDGNRIDFNYDERIDDTTVTAGCFHAYEADGDAHEGVSFDIISNAASGATIRIDFVINGESDNIVIAAADFSAVDADDDGDGSTRGSFDLSDRLEAGYSDGPDLEQAIPNASANRMTYCFDIDDTLDPGSLDSTGDFNLLKRDGVFGGDVSNGGTTHAYGDVFLGTGPENCTTIGYNDDGADAVARAVAAHVAQEPVSDLLPAADNDNREGFADDSSAGGGNEAPLRAHVGIGGPPPTGAPAGPPAPPGPPGPPAPPGGGDDCPPPYKVKKGNARDNKLKGGAQCDKLKGKGGDDVLRGKGEQDVLVGGPGDDVLIGGGGKDKCRGGPGDDVKRKC